MKLRHALLPILGALVLVAGCGGEDLPSRSEFTAQVKKAMGSDLKTAMTSAGASAETADKAIGDFIDCTYDKVKSNEDLLRKAYDDSGDKAVQAQLETAAKACTDGLTKAVTEAAGG